MIDPAAQSVASPLEKPSSGSRKDRGENSDGFSNTLSNVEQKNQKTSSRDDNGGDGRHTKVSDAASDGSDEAKTGMAARARGQKAIIDVSPSAIRVPARANEAVEPRGASTSDVETVSEAEPGAERTARKEQGASQDTIDPRLVDKLIGKSASSETGGVEETSGRGKRADEGATARDELDDVLAMLAGGETLAAALAGGANGAQGKGHAGSAAGKGESKMQVDAAARESDAGVAAPGAGNALKAAAKSADDSATGDMSDSSADRSFRFVRADGKGQPLILTVGRGADGASGRDQGNGVQDGLSTVTVLDSRRFIAPAGNQNISNILSAMSGDPEWVSAMRPGSELANAASQSSTGNVVNMLKIQMSPIDLGNVTATLRLNGDALTVHLTVENTHALKSLSEKQGDLVKALQAQGYAVDQVQVTVSTIDRSSTDAGQTGQQQSGQQAAQGGGQQGGSGNGGNEAGQSFMDNGGNSTSTGNIADDSTPASNPSDTSGGARPDHVYI